jgi:murein DD-endopeptidase MepM/ murein hydrolase activator NlpD
MIKIFFTTAVIILLAAGCGGGQSSPQTSQSGQPQPTSQQPISTSTSSAVIAPTAAIAMPISNTLSRVTKKFFGTYVTPQNSPVQPEKFKGYHTGADFETLPDEQNIDVPIYAICDGKLLMKKYASGYGGVAVESCKINSQDVTVIYGHLRLSSIIPNTGDILKPGDKIAVLGTGFSVETDGERKHLHLGIHKGSAINILGYVQNQSDLAGWIDPLTVLK